MWNFILYVIAVIVGLVLFFFYEEEKENTAKECTGELESFENEYRGKHDNKLSVSSLFAVLGLRAPGSAPHDSAEQQFEAFSEHFSSFEDVSRACRDAGLDSCGLIIGVDFTASNEWQGRKSFNQNCLHKLAGGAGTKVYNPYQKVISILGQTLEPFDDDNLIPAYGFGDKNTRDTGVFTFRADGEPCDGFQEVLEWYNKAVGRVTLGGPSNLAPIVNTALQVVKDTGRYHILVVICDGQVTMRQASADAIIEASKYPLSIIAVGVGDGPWQSLLEFDARLPARRFDNFRFVDYQKSIAKYRNHPEAAFALQALMEIPDQYKRIKALGYLGCDAEPGLCETAVGNSLYRKISGSFKKAVGVSSVPTGSPKSSPSKTVCIVRQRPMIVS